MTLQNFRKEKTIMEHTSFSLAFSTFFKLLVFAFIFQKNYTTFAQSLDSAIFDEVEREYAKDITSLVVESTLKSKCDGNIFIVSEECKQYIDHALNSISDWAPPIIVVNFQKYHEISDERKKSWNYYLAWERRPCSLIFICDLIKPKLPALNPDENNDNYQNNGTIIETDLQDYVPLGYVNFPQFFTSWDQIIYFQGVSENCQTTEIQKNSKENTCGGSVRNIETEGSILKQTGILLSVVVENPAENPEAVMRVYSKCDFCGPETRRHENYLGQWQRNKTLFGRFFETFNQFEKISFNNSNINIGYFNYPPHFSCKLIEIHINNYTEKENHSVCNGTEWEIISQMKDSLMFNFTLIHLGSEEPQKVASVTNFSQMTEALQNDRIDLAVGGISVTSERISMVDFSKIFATEPIVFVVEKPNNIFVLGIWLAFRTEVWPVIIITVAIISYLFRVIINRKTLEPSKIKASNRNLSMSALLEEMRRMPIKKPAHVAMFESLEITLQPLLGQPLQKSQISRNPRRLLKLLLTVWWFSCLIITIHYNTSLITSLINPVTTKEPESLQELIDSGYHFKLGCKHGSVYELISSVPDPTITDDLDDVDDKVETEKTKESTDNSHKEAAAKMIKLLQQVKARLIDNSESYSLTAYIIEESAINGITWSNHEIGFTQIKVIRERLFLTGYGFALKPQAAYKEKIDTALSRFGAAGLIGHWNSWFVHKNKETGARKLRLREKLGQAHLDLEILQGAFIFLIFGLSFAAAVFGLEHFTKHYTFQLYTRKQIFSFLRVMTHHLTWFYDKHLAEKPLIENGRNPEKFRRVVNTIVKINSEQPYKFLK